ncbi:MAG: hypothetical protein V3T86_00345 [Planctomycetota bacterium]
MAQRRWLAGAAIGAVFWQALGWVPVAQPAPEDPFDDVRSDPAAIARIMDDLEGAASEAYYEIEARGLSRELADALVHAMNTHDLSTCRLIISVLLKHDVPRLQKVEMARGIRGDNAVARYCRQVLSYGPRSQKLPMQLRRWESSTDSNKQRAVIDVAPHLEAHGIPLLRRMATRENGKWAHASVAALAEFGPRAASTIPLICSAVDLGRISPAHGAMCLLTIDASAIALARTWLKRSIGSRQSGFSRRGRWERGYACSVIGSHPNVADETLVNWVLQRIRNSLDGPDALYAIQGLGPRAAEAVSDVIRILERQSGRTASFDPQPVYVATAATEALVRIQNPTPECIASLKRVMHDHDDEFERDATRALNELTELARRREAARSER